MLEIGEVDIEPAQQLVEPLRVRGPSDPLADALGEGVQRDEPRDQPEGDVIAAVRCCRAENAPQRLGVGHRRLMRPSGVPVHDTGNRQSGVQREARELHALGIGAGRG